MTGEALSIESAKDYKLETDLSLLPGRPLLLRNTVFLKAYTQLSSVVIL